MAGKNNDIQKEEMDIQANTMTKSFWLTQKLMAELFQTTKQNISLHIQNIYNEGELPPEATVKEYLTVQKFYNNTNENQFKQSLYEAIEN